MTGQDAIEVGELMTVKQSGKALLNVVDCKVPQRITKVLTIDEMPGDIEFSPTGHMMASIVNSSMAEVGREDEPYQVTLLCWDTRSGELSGQTRLPYAEKIAPLDSDRIAIVTDQPPRADQDAGSSEGLVHLLVWNRRSGKTEQKFDCLTGCKIWPSVPMAASSPRICLPPLPYRCGERWIGSQSALLSCM